MTSISPDDPSPRRFSNRFCSRAVIVIWTLAFLGLCVIPLLKKTESHSVYPVFVFGGDSWLNGKPLYVRGGDEEFRYSPLIAAFFVPFDLMPDRLGRFVWRTLNFSVYLFGLLYCCGVGIPRALSEKQRSAILLLVIPFSIGSLNNAQSNPLVIGLLLISIAAAMGEFWTIAAVAIAIATFFKLYPIAVGLLLCLIYPRRFTWRFLVCLAVGALLPFVLQRAAYVIEQYQTWGHYLITEDRQRGNISDWYKDLRAVIRIYVTPISPKTYLIVELVAAAIIAIVCAWGRIIRWPRNVLLTMLLSLACCWMTALGPATESPTYILLAPITAWALVEADADRTHRRWFIAHAAVFTLFLAAQMALWFGPRGRWFREHLQPLPLAGTALFIILLLQLPRSPKPVNQQLS